MAFFIFQNESGPQAFRDEQAYVAFLRAVDVDEFGPWLYALRGFTALADNLIRRMAGPPTSARLEGLQKPDEQGRPTFRGLKPDDGFVLTDEMVRVALFDAIDGQDNVEVDRVAMGLEARRNQEAPDAVDYLNESGWWMRYDGWWYDPETRVYIEEMPQALATQFERDADLFACHDLLIAYNRHVSNNNRSARMSRDHEAFNALLESQSDRKERTINLHVGGLTESGKDKLDGKSFVIDGQTVDLDGLLGDGTKAHIPGALE